MNLPDPTEELLKGVKIPESVLNFCLGLIRSARPVDAQPGSAVCARASQAEECINLYGTTSSTPLLTLDLLEAAGELIERKAVAAGQASLWQRKLVLPDAEVADEFNAKLRHRQYSTFQSLVESFGGAVQRLQAIHLANALIANKVPMADAFDIDVKVCGFTATFASCKVPYSITPLASAYCEPEVWQRFPVAFRQVATTGLKCRRSDVCAKMNSVVEAVCAAASSIKA